MPSVCCLPHTCVGVLRCFAAALARAARQARARACVRLPLVHAPAWLAGLTRLAAAARVVAPWRGARDNSTRVVLRCRCHFLRRPSFSSRLPPSLFAPGARHLSPARPLLATRADNPAKMDFMINFLAGGISGA